MEYKEKLEKEGSKILHTYPHKVGGKPVYFVKNKHTEKRHKDEAELKKIRGHIDEMGAKARALVKMKH